MSIFKDLREEHGDIKQSLKKIIESEGRNDDYEVFSQKLIAHLQGEEKYFYPEIQGVGMTDQAETARKEHQNARQVLMRLQGMNGLEADWQDNLFRLQEILVEHISNEEKEIFSQAEAQLSSGRINDITESYLNLKAAMIGT